MLTAQQTLLTVERMEPMDWRLSVKSSNGKNVIRNNCVFLVGNWDFGIDD
jgi:hypothetical protein